MADVYDSRMDLMLGEGEEAKEQFGFIAYSDHKRIVEELEKKLAEASERYVQLWTRANYR